MLNLFPGDEIIMREIFGTICLVGAIQSVFLFFVLLFKKNNRKANRYLSIIMALTAIDMLELYLGARGYIEPARPYQLSIIPYSFMFGPSIYLYFALLTARIKTISKKHLFIFAPFVIALTVNIILQFGFDSNHLPGYVIYLNLAINGGGLIFESLLYALSLYALQKYINRLKEYFSAIDAMKLSLFRGALVVLIMIVIFIFLPFTREGHVRQGYDILDVIAILFGLVLGFGMAFFAAVQPEILNRVRLIDKAVPQDEPASSPRYEKLRLPASKEENYVKKLRNYMSENKPFLNEELTLQDLADEISLSTHHLSMILNIHFKQNFFNFINSYRVDEVKQKLSDPNYKNQNILTIALNAGFNSKSTFNTMFKKFTGKTPKEFRTGLSASG